MAGEINIRVQNGLSFDNFKKEVFDINGVSSDYTIIDSKEPDFVIFGPYGNDIPPKSNRYKRIGYFCENVIPDMSICEFAFGIPREEAINNPNYFRIQWHGFRPEQLVKNINIDFEEILNSKTKFCNFIYSNKVPYRERFFTQLSKYKKVDAPGKSMNNMANIDSFFQGNRWEAKRKFQSAYKFTLALESYVYPGYQTEKLYDSMLSNTIPVYIGDPFVSEIFNTDSFISISGHHELSFHLKKIEDFAQQSFVDYRPVFFQLPHQKFRRKIKRVLRDYKMKLLMNKFIDNIIERIIELDRNDDKYLEMYRQPWLKKNKIDENIYSYSKWRKIFDGK